MAEQETIRVVQELFASFEKGDLPGILDRLTDDVEWRLAGPTEITYAGTRRGRDQVAEFFKILEQTSEFEEFTPQEYIANLSEAISELQTMPGRLSMPVEQASQDAWIRNWLWVGTAARCGPRGAPY